MACKQCGLEKPIMAKGLCNACYLWVRRHGDTPKPIKNMPIEPRSLKNDRPCKVCGKIPVHAHELCRQHYARFLRHGHVEETRPVNYGKIGKHPMRGHWRWMIRTCAAKGSGWPKEWKENFEQFVEDVGERPGQNFFLTLIDPSLPYSKENVYWHEKQIVKHNTESKKDYARRYAKIYREKNPVKVKASELKTSFGITMSDYYLMLERQNHKCAICGNDETFYAHGKKTKLAVDHCHTTGKIRGLLCHRCNTALGNFYDSVELLQSAIQYLLSYSSEASALDTTLSGG